jgi:tetratricopeptide (TPR) repeat protein
MKIAFIANILAVALCASCATTSQPGGAPASASAAPTASALARAKQLGSDAQAALDAKEYAAARQAAGEAVLLNPQYEEAWIAYGMASLRLDKPDRAREAYSRALALHQAREGRGPRNPEEAYEEIYLLSLLRRDADAVELLRRARQEFPNDVQLANLATLYSENQQAWEGWKVK